MRHMKIQVVKLKSFHLEILWESNSIFRNLVQRHRAIGSHNRLVVENLIAFFNTEMDPCIKALRYRLKLLFQPCFKCKLLPPFLKVFSCFPEFCKEIFENSQNSTFEKMFGRRF
jgi:hypothetical protein